MSIAAGKMRQFVSIESNAGAGTYGSRGQVTDAWTEAATSIPCEIVQVSGDEGVLTRQAFPTATHTVRMRYRSDIDPSDRLVLGSRVFNILNLSNTNEMNVEHVATVAEEVATS